MVIINCLNNDMSYFKEPYQRNIYEIKEFCQKYGMAYLLFDRFVLKKILNKNFYFLVRDILAGLRNNLSIHYFILL